jgi:hypothetical protein
MFVVVLEMRLRGACVGSTEDVIDAADAAEAEELAIAAWRAAEPDLTFAPLVTVAAQRFRA